MNSREGLKKKRVEREWSSRLPTEDSAKEPNLPTARDSRVAPRAALLVPPARQVGTHRVEQVGTRARAGVKPRLWDPPVSSVSVTGRRPGR